MCPPFILPLPHCQGRHTGCPYWRLGLFANKSYIVIYVLLLRFDVLRIYKFLYRTGVWLRAGRLLSALLFEHGEGLVLGGLHDFAFARPFVVDAAEVQHAVYDDAVQLVHVFLAKLRGV